MPPNRRPSRIAAAAPPEPAETLSRDESMKLSRGVLSLLTVLVIFLVVGAGVAWRLLGATEDGESTARPELPDTEGVQVASAEQFTGAQPVQGVEVVRDTLWVRVIGDGQAEAFRRSVVATRASGVVQQVHVAENQFVDAGTLLVQLDTTEAAMNLAQARSALLERAVEFEERMLFAGQVLTDPEAVAERERNVRVQSGLANAEVEVARREMEMEFTRIRAPFAGRVADLEAVEGAFVSTGAEVLTLVQIDPIKVEVGVLERDIGGLAAGRRASVRFTGVPDETFTARVESVNPIVDPESRQGRVTLVLSNPRGTILPGMYARVSMDAEAFPGRVLVPREAVVERGDRRRQVVFMVRNPDENGNGVAEWRYVTTGRRNETHVEIVEHEDTDMLQPGEIVLIDGHHYLAHDTPVRLVENVLAAGGRPGR